MHEICGSVGDLGVATFPQPILGSSYEILRQWNPGGVSSTSNTPRIIHDLYIESTHSTVFCGS